MNNTVSTPKPLVKREKIREWRRNFAISMWKANDHAFWHPWWEQLKTEKVEMDYSDPCIENLHTFPVPKNGNRESLLEQIL